VWICVCEAVNSGAIVEAIRSGADSVGAVGEATRAGEICGKCKRNIAVLLAQHAAGSDPRQPAEKGR
jgi:NAD(P)H-nitrite reductase large subunit